MDAGALIQAESLSREEGARKARALFVDTFGYDAQGVWSAPGRVNIIGEHVDYNGGPCLPIALPHRAYLALSPREDRTIRLVSSQTRDTIDVWDLDTIGPKGSPGEITGWSAYIAGVAWALEQLHDTRLPGFDAALCSCVPQGGGLSSSAALECAIAVALDEVGGLDLAGSESNPNDEGRTLLAQAAIRAENDIAGANTGGLDQTASLKCQAGHALALDCRDFSTQLIPFEPCVDGLELLVIDTRAAHSLVDGQYASRRADCERAAQILGVHQLVEVDDLDEAMRLLDEERIRRRVRHVVSEIARTRAFIELLEGGPLVGSRLRAAGLLLNDSHDSLRDDYEVTVRELDVAVDAAREAGAHGARMTGGGFGGSVIALVDQERSDEIAHAIARAFAEQGLRAPHFARATPSGPAAREA